MPCADPALRFRVSRVRFWAPPPGRLQTRSTRCATREARTERGSRERPLVRPPARRAASYFFIGSSATAIAWVYVTSTLSPGLILPS
jgi:hypothetical protein